MRKNLLLFCLLFGFVTFGQAETMYLTLLNSNATKKEDVAVKLDKKDASVSDFLVVDVSNRSPEVLSHPAGRRQYLLLFDLLHSKPEEIVQARNFTTTFLEKLGKDDLVAVAAIGKTTGLRFLSGFTTDRNKINAGLNAIGIEKLDGVLQGPDGNLYSLQFAPQAHSVALIPEDKFLANVTLGIGPEEKKKADDTISLFVGALSDLALSLASMEGRKNLVLFSPGFDTKGAKIEVSEENFSDKYVDVSIRDDTYINTVEEDRAQQEARRKQERERAPGGPAVQVDGIPEFVAGTFTSVQMVSPSGQEYDFFKKLTAHNGGQYLRQVQDPAAGADQILNVDKKYVIIGFDGKTEREFKKAHDLKITAAGSDVPTSGWVSPRPFANYTQVERRIHLSEAVYKNYDQPIGGEKFWADVVFEHGQPHIPVFAQLPGTGLIKKDIDNLALEFYSFLVNADGTIVDFAAIPVRMDLKNKQLRERLNQSGIKVWSQLLGNPGQATVRCVLVDSTFGDTITFTNPLEIQSAELTTSYPFFPATNLQWLVWPKPQDQQSKRGVQLRYPYEMGSEQMFFPDLTPSLKKDESGQVVYFKIYNKPAGAKNPPIKLQLQDQSGKSTEIDQFALMQNPKDIEQGGMELFWKLQAIPDVPPGTYQFKVNIKDMTKNKEVVRTIPMLVQ
jgi:VWFA-related protein